MDLHYSLTNEKCGQECWDTRGSFQFMGANHATNNIANYRASVWSEIN